MNIEEKEKILKEFNNTKREYPKNKTIIELFEEQVEKTPNNIAVIYEEESISYKELNMRANTLGDILREKGVGAESIVGIAANKSVEMIVGIIGILKAGGAYLPIDPDYPEDRVRYMLEDSDCKILLSQENLMDRISFDGEIININNKNIYKNKLNNLRHITNSENLAYIIYTSGTTGKPKGVAVTNKNTVRLVKNTNFIQFNEGDRILQTGSITFDASTFEIWGAFLNGISLYLTNKDVILDADKLEEYINHNNITIMWLTSPLFNKVCQENEKVFNGLRCLLVGGDVVSPKNVNQVKKYSPNLIIINGYGPTENTTFSTCYIIGENFKENTMIPIGKPISNSTAYILDGNKGLVSIGVMGELYVGGDGVARGYLNKSELTKEKFVDNPFEEGSKMYKTGDLARWLPDGNIEFLGRLDHQVKIRGFRIEPGEIENALLNIKGIKETIVIDREENGDKYLCAYVVMDKHIGKGSIKEQLSKKIPSYMIPSFIVPLEEMPLNANGKVNRKLLPNPDKTKLVSGTYESPRNDIEKSLAQIWKEVLGIDKIGINDNFFDLGGHSLKATTLLGKINKEFNVRINIKDLYNNPTIKLISSLIQEKEISEYRILEKAKKKKYYEASSSEKRMYSMWQMDKSTISYNIPVIIDQDEYIKPNIVKDALTELIKRHEALRTKFSIIDGEIVQVVMKSLDFDFEYEEVEENDTVIKNKVVEFIKPFDLSKAPLMRAKVLRINENRSVIILDFHHIIADGVSIGVLTNEFFKIYKGEKLEPCEYQYKDYSEWQKNTKEEAVKKEEYWMNRFSGEIPVLNLIPDFKRPSVMTYEGDKVNFKIDKELTERLYLLARKNNTSLFTVLLSAYNILLSKYTGQEDIIIGTAEAGRKRVEFENIVGMFVNTVALRNYPERNKNFRDFLKEVSNNTMQDFEYADYQFEELVDKLRIKRDASRNPLFDTMFVLQNMNLDMKTLETDLKIAKFDLTFTAYESDNGIEFSVEYYNRIYKEETIQRMNRHFVKILEGIVEDSNIRLSALSVIDDEEKEKILNEFNNTKRDYPENKTIIELFEEQVEKTPDNIAVIYEGESISYKELNMRANALGKILREKGVWAEYIVGIMTNRSLEMIVGIMGILKAGGAYLPIDPDYPEDRIRYMLEDSNCKILLSQENLIDKMSFDREVINISDRNKYNNGLSNLDHITNSGNLAYIIYTSGTTGKPKGVMVEHKSLVNLCYWHNKNYEIREDDRATKYAGVGFDASVWEIFPYIIIGASLYIVPDKIVADVEKLSKFIDRNAITVTFLPTQVCEELMDYENDSLRILLTGADKLKKYKEKTYRIVNNYGPTENTVVTTSFIVDKQYDNIPIGKPIFNVSVYILNDKAIAPIGIPGELCISGDGIARGYINKTELTKEKFVDNPFKEDSKMYRTGDLARWLPDGNIEFLGRIDHQVKIRGFRIELGEIENALLNIKGIKETIVIDKEEDGDKYLCAYVVMDKQIDEEVIREQLSNKIPSYMIPSFIMSLEEMPLNANGKVDRKLLPEIDKTKLAEKAYEAPKDEIEQELVKMWEQVLKIDKVGINDNFIDLGGHSLKATKIAAEVRKRFGFEVPLVELIKGLTIKNMADKIRKSENADKHIIDNGAVLIKKSIEDNRNFFLIHSLSGEVEVYSKLCIQMRNDFNYWGIRVQRDKYFGPEIMNLSQLAKEYINKIREVQKEGPYFIGGWCIGGIISYEVTRQLEEMGESIEFLALFNSPVPEGNAESIFSHYEKFKINEEWSIIEQIYPLLNLKEKYSELKEIEDIWKAAVTEFEKLEFHEENTKKIIYTNICNIAETISLLVKDYTETNIKQIVYYFNLFRSIAMAAPEYIPDGKIKSKVHYFIATKDERENRGEWIRYCYKIKYYKVEGGHFTIFEEDNDVKKLAKQIDVALKNI